MDITFEQKTPEMKTKASEVKCLLLTLKENPFNDKPFTKSEYQFQDYLLKSDPKKGQNEEIPFTQFFEVEITNS